MAVQQALEAEPATGTEHGHDMAVGQRALDRHELPEVTDSDTALEHGAEALDDMIRQHGEVGDGLLADPGPFAPACLKSTAGLPAWLGMRSMLKAMGRSLWEHETDTNRLHLACQHPVIPRMFVFCYGNILPVCTSPITPFA